MHLIICWLLLSGYILWLIKKLYNSNSNRNSLYRSRERGDGETAGHSQLGPQGGVVLHPLGPLVPDRRQSQGGGGRGGEFGDWFVHLLVRNRWVILALLDWLCLLISLLFWNHYINWLPIEQRINLKFYFLFFTVYKVLPLNIICR